MGIYPLGDYSFCTSFAPVTKRALSFCATLALSIISQFEIFRGFFCYFPRDGKIEPVCSYFAPYRFRERGFLSDTNSA